MGSLPAQSSLSLPIPPLVGNLLPFLRTSSKPELTWFMDAVSAHFLQLVRDSYGDPLLMDDDEKRVPFYHPSSLFIDLSSRYVSLIHSTKDMAVPEHQFAAAANKADVFTVIATFLADFLNLALGDDVIEGPKQSRFRGRITTVIAVEGIWDRLKGALDERAKGLLEERWSSENLVRQKQERISGAAQNPNSVKLSSDATADGTGKVRQVAEAFDNGTHVQMNGNARHLDGQVTIVVPAAGRSSRFPGHKPKWLLTQPNGCLMVVDALGALDLSSVSRVVVGILKDHLVRYCGNDANALLKAFEDGNAQLKEIPISIVVIPEETIDQVQTIECILDTAKVTGPIFLKDCDNQFSCSLMAQNGVATLEITQGMQSVSIPASKSYVSLSSAGAITNIAEKVILSNTFCLGGYSFRSASETLNSICSARRYQKLTSTTNVELSVSDIVWLKMLEEQVPFVSIPSIGYEDWGTLEAWNAYTRTWKTLFCDIDGTLFKNTGQYFTPNWTHDSGVILPSTIKHLQTLRARGRTQIILTTTRPESFAKLTERQLKASGVPFDRICYGLYHCQRVLINDWAKTNPFPSALAVNLQRNGDELREMLDY